MMVIMMMVEMVLAMVIMSMTGKGPVEMRHQVVGDALQSTSILINIPNRAEIKEEVKRITPMDVYMKVLTVSHVFKISKIVGLTFVRILFKAHVNACFQEGIDAMSCSNLEARYSSHINQTLFYT